MSLRISPDKNQPSVAIEIPLEQPLPDYDLHQIVQPTPREIDALLVSQGFRDLVDDARGVLTESTAAAQFLAAGGSRPHANSTFRDCATDGCDLPRR
jgi:hypothetical protein